MLKRLKHNNTLKRLLANKKRLIYIAVAVIGILCIKFIFFSPSSNQKPDAKIVEVATVERQAISETTRFIGTIRAQQATMLMIKAKGVLDILIPPGSHVKKGDLIGKIRGKDIDNNTILSKDSVAIAKIQYERTLQLQKKGIVSKSAVEEKKSIWIEEQKKLSDANFQRDQINIDAPFDGIIGLFKIKDGSQVQEGEALVNLYDPTSLMVEFDIPMDIVQTIKDQTPVTIDNKHYQLTYVQRMLDEETHMCPAYVNIQCNDCIIGATRDVDVVIAQKKSVIVILYEAIFLRDGKPYVYLVKNNRATLTPVTLGIREKEQVEITSGIAAGDRVIIRGQARLYPGAPVTIAPLANNAEKQAK